MARALLVGCGCRGRGLGTRLLAEGWQVRGTSRTPDGVTAIERAGIEPARVDPDRAATVLEHVADVTLVFWLLGEARGEPEQLAAIHGTRLERLLERLVDTPVRGFVYEAAGTVEPPVLEGGAVLVGGAAERWRIPAEIVRQPPGDHAAWAEAMLAAAHRLVAQ